MIGAELITNTTSKVVKLFTNTIFCLHDGSAQRIPPVAREWIPANRGVKGAAFRLQTAPMT